MLVVGDDQSLLSRMWPSQISSRSARITTAPPAVDFPDLVGGADLGGGIEVDNAGNAYLIGSTSSPAFSTSPRVFQSIFCRFQGGFVERIIDVVLPLPPTIANMIDGGSMAILYSAPC
jgi:hypothetical protein